MRRDATRCQGNRPKRATAQRKSACPALSAAAHWTGWPNFPAFLPASYGMVAVCAPGIIQLMELFNTKQNDATDTTSARLPSNLVVRE
jgi:hypothetical protein